MYKRQEDSFGLLGLASAGAIISTLVLGLFIDTFNLGSGGVIEPIEKSIFQTLLAEALNVGLSFMPIILIFAVIQIFKFRFNRKASLRIIKGMVYSFIGLTLFMTGVNGGFMAVGREVGTYLNLNVPDFVVFIVGFILGMLVILAEPAVYVLTRQIEDVTSGSIKRFMVVKMCIRDSRISWRGIWCQVKVLGVIIRRMVRRLPCDRSAEMNRMKATRCV